MEPPFPACSHSYAKALKLIVDHGHNGIFGNSKPIDMGDGLWKMLQVSWGRDPSGRPSMLEIENQLQELYRDL